MRLLETHRTAPSYAVINDLYKPQFAGDMEEVILAYGDSITLLKKEDSRPVDIDTSGLIGKRGRLGGRRIDDVVMPKQIPVKWKRPMDIHGIAIPAIVEISPTLERREMFGIKDSGSAIVTMSTKWLEEREIVIDNAQDLFLYKSRKYKIQVPDISGNFLNMSALLVYTLERL